MGSYVCAAMLCPGLKPDMVSYNAVISACEKGAVLLQALTSAR